MSENRQSQIGSTQNNISMKPRSRLRRLGCGIGLLTWAILIFLPCLAIILISQGEITIQMGEVPGQSLRIWLIQDATDRGIGFARPSVHYADNENTCLQTDTSFILWMGKGEATSYCECYSHSGENWEPLSTTEGFCNP